MAIIAVLLTSWEFYLALLVIFATSKVITWLKDPLRHMPGPRGYPIIGRSLDYSLSKDMHKVLLEKERKYGKIYKESTVRGR